MGGNIMAGMDHQTLETDMALERNEQNEEYVAAYKFLTDDDNDSIDNVN